MKRLPLIFIIAFILNAFWENFHSFLYGNYKGGNITEFILLRASLFDAFLITIISLPFLYFISLKNKNKFCVPSTRQSRRGIWHKIPWLFFWLRMAHQAIQSTSRVLILAASRRGIRTSHSNKTWLIIILGIIIAILNEWFGLKTNRWVYNELMPIIPIIKTGLTPTFQLGILGFISFNFHLFTKKQKLINPDQSPQAHKYRPKKDNKTLLTQLNLK